MAVLTHETLKCVNISSQIALANVDGVDSYGHAYIIIDGRPVEPRYLGLYLQGNIDYDNPYSIYNSTDEYMCEYVVFDIIDTII